MDSLQRRRPNNAKDAKSNANGWHDFLLQRLARPRVQSAGRFMSALVISGHTHKSASCPLYPRYRTFSG